MSHYTPEKEKDKKNSYRSEKKAKTLATQINQQVGTRVDEKDQKRAVSCPCCSKSHDLEQCKSYYLDKSINYRSKFLVTKKLCYCCLKTISKTHSARTCNQRRTCKDCADNHASSLHGFKKKGSQRQEQDGSKNLSNESPQEQTVKSNVTAYDKNIACASTSMKHQYIRVCLIPVIIRHMDSPKDFVTHTILDSCSQGGGRPG